MRSFLLFVTSLIFIACSSGTGRQEIDLTEQTLLRPSDGIGHYVYALSLPESIGAGETLEIQMDWRTVGPADMRKRYAMEVRLNGEKTKIYRTNKYQNTVGEANLVNWINYYLPVPADFPPGNYQVEVRLINEDEETAYVILGFKEDLFVEDGFYRVADVVVD